MDIDDILNDPLLEIDETQAALFDFPDDMQKVMKGKKKADYVAHKKHCENFEDYEPLFAQVRQELKEGKRLLLKSGKAANFSEGNFYVVDGVVVYLESIGKYSKGSNGMQNARTRCIYENGTEQDEYLSTLRKNVSLNGYIITNTVEEQNASLAKNADLTKDDQVTGFIYVLRSLSQVAAIASQKDLFKIGFTTNTVEERIANAAQDPTYLMAEVEVVASYKVVNMNSQMFEGLVHQVLEAARFHVKVKDLKGQLHEPKEWYVAPLAVVDAIMKKIVDRSIVNYRYNAEMQCLERVVRVERSRYDLTGLRVLTLPIERRYFDEIMSGEKTVEYRQLKQTTISRYTYLDPTDGKRYLRPYDVLRLGVGYATDRETALIQITDIVFDEENKVVEYHLGRILEHLNDKRKVSDDGAL
ncbi:MAG: GIY-YIG nuclease family protein [Bacteroidales bacterium]|nr:GIY-YIG nuclease family protein [Bacteroidales bacterium]